MTALPTTATQTARTGRAATRGYTVDVCGVSWPLYKVEALVIGLVTLLVGLAFAALAGATAAPAILAASGTTVAAWWALRALHAR